MNKTGMHSYCGAIAGETFLNNTNTFVTEMKNLPIYYFFASLYLYLPFPFPLHLSKEMFAPHLTPAVVVVTHLAMYKTIIEEIFSHELEVKKSRGAITAFSSMG